MSYGKGKGFQVRYEETFHLNGGIRLVDQNSTDGLDLWVIENQEEHKKDILMQDVWEMKHVKLKDKQIIVDTLAHDGQH
jgi:hypothetical protein